MAAVLGCQKANLVPFLTKKSLNFEKFRINSWQQTRIEQFSHPSLSLEIKSMKLQLIMFAYFIKIDENLVSNTEKVKKIS